jgi:DNA topoisomerase-1
MSLLGGFTDGYFGGGVLGMGTMFGMPYPVLDATRSAPDPGKKVKPEDPIERTFYSLLYAGREMRNGFDKAPPLSLDLIWRMRRFNAIVLAFAAVTRQILSGTQSIEILNKTADPDLAAAIKAAAEEDLLPSVPDWFAASLECLHFGNWLQEIEWTRKGGRTVPACFRSFRPGEVTIYQDAYGQFAGYQLNSEYRDARYGFLSVNQPQIHPVAGYSRNENCRQEYWRIQQSELNADKTENKASDRQMVIKWPMGLSLTDDKGNKVFSKDFAQEALNASVRGDAMVVPRFFWDQVSLKNNPALAEIEPVTVEAIDWGNIGPSIEAHLSRIAALKTDCQRAWSRPERESTESAHGSKADSSSAADLGTSDSEAVANERMREFNKQVLDRWAITNFGPDAAGIVGIKQGPLADPKQDFLQKQSIAITSDATTGPGYQANFDQRALAERVGIPLVSEEDAQKVIDKQEQDKADAQKQQMDAMKAKAGQNGAPPQNGNPAANGNGRMKLSADEAEEREEIADRLWEYMRPLESDGNTTLMLEAAATGTLTGGEWKTIDGAHVYIKDGVVVAGAKGMIGNRPDKPGSRDESGKYHGANQHLVGKTEEGVESHGKASPKSQFAGYHAIERDATGAYKGTRQEDGSIKHVQEHADRLAKNNAPAGHTDVHLSHDLNADVPVKGRDSKGKIQGPRSEAAEKAAYKEKFDRNDRFHAAIPAIRERIEADLHGNHAEEAAVLSVMDKMGFRVGGDEDTGAKVKAYGTTTLNASHVTVEGDSVRFQFIGKKGVAQDHTIHDAKLAAMIGPRVAKGGDLFNTSDSKSIDYLRNISGQDDLKNHDFRTEFATENARNVIKSMPTPTNLKELVAARKAVSEAVARKLGNNPSEAQKSYINQKVYKTWHAKAANHEQLQLIQKHAAATGLSENAAAADWIVKGHAKAYRDKFEKAVAVL